MKLENDEHSGLLLTSIVSDPPSDKVLECLPRRIPLKFRQLWHSAFICEEENEIKNVCVKLQRSKKKKKQESEREQSCGRN